LVDLTAPIGGETRGFREWSWARSSAETLVEINPVDVGILIVVGISAVGGLRRGFLLGTIDLVAFALSLVVAARLTDAVAAPLREWGIGEPLASGAAFVVAAVVSLAVIGLAGRVILSPLGAISAGTPLGWANSVLGLLPGAVRGLLVAALLILLLTALPAEFGIRRQISSSWLAAPISALGEEALEKGLVWAGIDPWELGIFTQPPVSGAVDLPFSGVTDLEIDDEAQDQLFALINQERAGAGLTPLQRDSALAEAARRHSREMFRLGVFSHTSPTTGSPADRIETTGSAYTLSGENIALAQTAQAAHDGLMESPPHRANILNPGFTHVGIGALRHPEHGLMVTEEFGG
jgi:uncharacterized membrane protein required for colicin V production